MKHAKVQRPLDHDPVAVRFESSPDFSRARRCRNSPHWISIDLLGLATIDGVPQVRSSSRKPSTEHRPLKNTTLLTPRWLITNRGTSSRFCDQADTDLFAQGLHSKQMDDYKALLDQREAALIQRRRCRAKLVASQEEQTANPNSEHEILSWKLKERTQQATRSQKKMGEEQKGESSREQLVEAQRTGSPCHGLQDLPTPLRQTRTQSQKPPQQSKNIEPANKGRLNWPPPDTWEAWEPCRDPPLRNGKDGPAPPRSREKEEPDANAHQEAEDLTSALSR